MSGLAWTGSPPLMLMPTRERRRVAGYRRVQRQPSANLYVSLFGKTLCLDYCPVPDVVQTVLK